MRPGSRQWWSLRYGRRCPERRRLPRRAAAGRSCVGVGSCGEDGGVYGSRQSGPARNFRVMKRLVALLLAPGLVGAQMLTGKGVSIELAQHRALTIRNVRYDLALDVTAPDSAIGHVIVHWTRADAGPAIIDFRGRRLTHMSANGTLLPSSTFNGAHVELPASSLVAGENNATFDFVSDIAPSGASIIKSHDPDGSDYLYTLLVPADANQLFPCFDQPDLKARVSLRLTAPPGWLVVGNGSITKSDTAGEFVTHQFTETKPISTYLIAFAAGPWAVASSTENGRTVHVYVRKSRMKEADGDTLLALNHRAIRWMESYFA